MQQETEKQEQEIELEAKKPEPVTLVVHGIHQSTKSTTIGEE